MSPLIRGLTIALWALPLFFGIFALVSRQLIAGIVFLFLITLYGLVWLWCRPSCFVVYRNYVEIVFPGWRRKIPMQDVSSIRIISNDAFQQEFGWAMRIGVGGLWGGFGWLWTYRRGFLEFYISQLDNFVLIERVTEKSVLITPENPGQLVEVVEEAIA
ncbi:PH domain-containing protein [Chlorogloeopsis fritschii]|uniref:PH domain-containing protein n=1 Tax=Chlorogloeopsis fritschii TaxID=1124 RepID=UPI0023F2471A|nr:PH domain-containing protein [Chlorogloeopsis fritschii]